MWKCHCANVSIPTSFWKPIVVHLDVIFYQATQLPLMLFQWEKIAMKFNMVKSDTLGHDYQTLCSVAERKFWLDKGTIQASIAIKHVFQSFKKHCCMALACHSQLWLQLISKEQRACMIFLQHNFSTMILLQSWMQAKLSSNSCVILLGWLQFELTSHSQLINYLMFWMTVHVAKWMSSENKTSLCHLLPSCWHFIKCQTQ